MLDKLAIKGGEPVRKKPFPKWPIFDEREMEALKEVLYSGVWGIGGTKKKEFEEKFAAYQNAKYGVAVTNGTAALEIALRAAGIGAGDEVIMPAYTFMATAVAALYVGALPVFVDIEPDTCNINPEKVEEAITDRTRAIIPVHIGGRPVDMDSITKIADERDLVVIEDACQAWGAEWRSRRVGAIGDLGAFSFQSSKNITSGEGGIIVTNDEDLYMKCWSYHNCGRTLKGEWYHHVIPGANYRITEFQAAILLVQLERLDEQTERRNENARYLTNKLSEIEGIETLSQDSRITRHAYHLYIFKYIPEEFNNIPKERFVEALRAEGIPCSPGYVPLYRERFMLNLREDKLMQKLYGEKVDYSRVSLPVTEDICYRRGIWLPQYVLLGTKEDMDDIVKAITKIKESSKELAD